jgi:hypothetical protein
MRKIFLYMTTTLDGFIAGCRRVRRGGLQQHRLAYADIARHKQRAAPDRGLIYERVNEFDVLIPADQRRTRALPGRTTTAHRDLLPRPNAPW